MPTFANVVKDTAAVLSVVPVIGAVSSQIGSAANIISSVSSAGTEIISVGERYVAKQVYPGGKWVGLCVWRVKWNILKISLSPKVNFKVERGVYINK